MMSISSAVILRKARMIGLLAVLLAILLAL
jgi:hypothetical protein